MSTRSTSPADPDLTLLLRQAETLVARASNLALALNEPSGILLPPPVMHEVDQAQLRATATLYLASELEAAGLIPAAEDLVRLASTGAPNIDFGEAAGLMHAFWRGRNDRVSSAERRGFVAGLFGTHGGPEDAGRPLNLEFEDRFLDLCEALYKLDLQASNRVWGGVAQQTRVRSAARRLLGNLRLAMSGMTLFLAQEILTALREALAILRQPAVRAGFGVRGLWELVAAVDRRMRRPPRKYALYLRRGKSGLTVLAWLADAAPVLTRTNEPLLGLDHPVIGAAVDWMEASLALTDNQTGVPTGTADSPWSMLAG